MQVCEDLRAAGHVGWLVGGTARDLLRGREPKDYDIGVAASPAVLRAALPGGDFGVEQVGEDYGTLRLRTPERVVELTSFRRESSYSDRRHPDHVEFVSDLEVDAARRDLTVNAIYLDPIGVRVIDPFDGLCDLRNGRLRAIGDASQRLSEDPLRILRALRLAAVLDHVPDAGLWTAIRSHAALVRTLTPTRIRLELEGLLCARGRGRGLMLLVRAGVAPHVLPGLAELADVPQPPQYHPEGDVLRHTALVLAALEEPVDPRLAWAALFHDFGKKDTFEIAEDRIRFHNHDVVSAEKAALWLRAHGAPTSLVTDVESIIREHIRIASVPGFRPAKRARFLFDPLFPLHLAFHRADCLASHAKLDIHAKLEDLRRALPEREPEPLLRGRDLLALGMQPGPAIGRSLAAVADARAEGRVSTREEALEFLRSEASRDSMSGTSTPKGKSGKRCGPETDPASH